MSQNIVDVWDGVQNTNSWVHDGDVERSAVDIVELASSVAGYSAGAQAAAAAASGYADTASGAVASIGTAATDAVQAVQNEGTAQISALVDAGGVQTSLIGSAGAAQLADIVTSGGIQISSVGSAGAAQITAITSAGGAQVALVSAAGTSATGDLAAVTAAQSAALVSAGGYQSGLIATAGSAQIAAVQAEGGTQIAAVQLAASAQVSSATVAAMSAGAAASTAQGAASAASGYAVSAGSFVPVTSGYATSAGSAASVASGYALTASSYMTSAGGYASAATDSANDAADSATAAQASAESIEASAEQIQTNADNITALETKTDITNKNVANIQALLNGTLYREETDSTAAYSKAVPTGAMPYASIDEIGGKTVVWNQLQQPLSSRTRTKEGLTFTSDGTSVTVSGVKTGTGTTWISYGYLENERVPVIQDHKYLLRGCPSGGSNTTYRLQMSAEGIGYDYGNGVIGTANSTSSPFVYINILTTEEITNLVFSVELTDLTLMFGAGNEPATVAEFEAMFPNINLAYNAGELRSAGVTDVVSEGRNLFDMSEGRGYPSDTTISNKTPREFPLHKWVLGISYNNYFYLGNVNSATVDEDANIITVASKVTGYGVGVPFKCEPNTAYTITYTSTVSTVGLAFYSKENNYISYNSMQSGRTVSSPSTAYNALLVFYSEANTTAVFSNIQLERGSTATAYTPPYFSRTLPIPSAVQALPGYGWSAGSAYNYIDFERKVYVQNVGSVTVTAADVPAADSAYIGSGTFSSGTTYTWIRNFKYDASPAGSAFRERRYGGYAGLSKKGKVVINDQNIISTQYRTYFTDVSSRDVLLTLIGDGMELYYELATPIETDISSLLTDSTIEVEPGGTLTFKNQHGDDFRLPVPNEETFLVQATPELPTTDGTYTLQCTVTDGTPSVTWVTA